MTRKGYIRKTLQALCGSRPASPDEYYRVVRMADDAAGVYEFDRETK